MVTVIGSATSVSVATMWTLLPILLFVPVLTIHGRQLNLRQAGSAWQDLKSAGDMHGRDKRYVQLAEGETMTSFEPCVHPSGRPGHCKHLHQCGQEDLQDNMVYMDYLCVIGTSTIGVCCPDPIGQGQEGLAGDLPATALKDEGNDALTRITRAENRGCGVSTRAASRLVGARPTSVREWPWMASVTPEGFESYCGGVLITDRHVMTAAHCTRRWKAEELEVLLGEYDFDSKTDTRTYHFRVIEKRQHEDFDNVTYHNDIAILKLDRPATFNTYVWPICLPPPGLNVVNESAYIVGWGTQWFGGPTSHVLMEVSVPVWEHQHCVDSFADSIFEETLCAAAYEGGRDACQGDSGGPLMYQLPSGRWSVLGIVSWGVRCGEATHPGLYTRVDKYLRWIVQNARF